MRIDEIDLTDVSLWSRPDLPELIDGLRARGPVLRMDTHSDGPIWSVVSYDHGVEVLSDAASFSSRSGSLLLGYDGAQIPAGSQKMMALSDPPLHREFRAPMMPFFSRRGVDSLSTRITELAASVVEEAVQRNEVDLVEVFAVIPLVVMCDLLDIPEQDRDQVLQFCDQAFLAATAQDRRAGHQQLMPYLFQQAILRSQHPGDDLISRLAVHQAGDRRLSIEEVVLNLDNIIVGGVQTVRHAAAMSIFTLMHNPHDWHRLHRGDLQLGLAVDELLRWTSVGLHVLRTATRDMDFGNVPIRQGEKVVVWTWAANHDPAAFDRPHELRLDRTPNRHIAFGIGPHYCIGAQLAKAELVAILSALLARVAEIEPTEAACFNQSIINFGFDHFPVRLKAR